MHFPDRARGRRCAARREARRRTRAVPARSSSRRCFGRTGPSAPSSWRRNTVSPFSDHEIALLKTFADQAAIAIQNARMFNETKEALERQTATANVLKAISRSTFDLGAVLETLISTAARLCRASLGVIFKIDGDVCRPAGLFGATPALIEHLAAHPPLLSDQVSLTSRAVTGRQRHSGRGCADRSRVRAQGCPAGRGLPHAARGPDHARRRSDRRADAGPDLRTGLQREGNRSRHVVCRPGRDRDGKRAPVQRDQGGAGAADRDLGSAAGHQQFGGRHGSRCSTRSWRAASTCSMARSCR